MDFTEAYDDTSTSLGLAARVGDVKSLKELLHAGRPTNGHDNRGWRPLHEAASHGHEECVRLLVMAEDAEIEALTFDGLTALYLAVVGHRMLGEDGPSGAVRALLQAGADPNMATGDQWSLPLPRAIGNIALVRQLLEGGADPNIEEDEGGTSLHKAVECGSVEEVALLLSCGADVTKTGDVGQTPLHTLMFRHSSLDEPILDLLLEHSADVNARDVGGITPLMLAVQKGWKHGVWKLLENGADVDITSSNGVLALHFAIEFPKRECKPRKMRMPYNEEEEEGGATSGLASVFSPESPEESTEILEKLLPLTSKELYMHTPCDPSKPARIRHSFSLFHLGVQWERYKCLKVLIDAGIPADLFLQDTSSSIMDAEDVRLFRQTPLIVDIGATMDTPLAFLLSKPLTFEVVEMAKYMIDKGSSVNAVHPSCMPPLVAAVRYQRASYGEGTPSLQILCCLLQHGADVKYKIRENDVLPAALHVSALFNPAAFFQLLLSGVSAHTIYTHATLKALRDHYTYSWPTFYDVYPLFPWRVISWLNVLDLFVPQLPLDTRLMFDRDGSVDDPNLKNAWKELDVKIGSPKTLQQLSVLCVRCRIGEARSWKWLPDALEQLSSQVHLPQAILNLLHFKQVRTASLFRAPPPSAMLLYAGPDSNISSSSSSESLVASSFTSEPRVEEMDVDEEEEEEQEDEENEEEDKVDDEQEEGIDITCIERNSSSDNDELKCNNDDSEERDNDNGDDNEKVNGDIVDDINKIESVYYGGHEVNDNNDEDKDSDNESKVAIDINEDEKKNMEVGEETGISGESKLSKEENVEDVVEERKGRKRLRKL